MKFKAKKSTIKPIEGGFRHRIVNSSPDTNLPMTTFNLSNSILGAGIIGVPFAIREAGFGLGIIIILLIGFLTDYTLCLLVHARILSGKNSYASVAKAAFGQPAFIIVSILVFVYPIIAMVGFNVILGDMATRLLIRITDAADVDELRENFWGRREFLIAAIALVALLPLSLYRNIGKLSKWAAISIVAIVVLAVMFAVRLGTLDLPATPDAYEFADIEFIQGIGILAFGYMCHHSSFLIFDSMIRPTEKRSDEVTHLSVIISLTASLVIGIIGYVTFTKDTVGDLLENYCTSDDLINAGRFLYLISIIISYPVELFVARNVLNNTLFAHQPTPAPMWRHFLVTFTLVVITYAGSLITECLGIVLEFNGIVTAAPLAYILPPLLVLKLQKEPVTTWKSAPKFLVLLFGAFVSVAGLTITIKELVEGTISCTEGQEAAFCLANSTV